MFNFVSLLKYKRQITGSNCVNLRSVALPVIKIKHSILIITEVIKKIILTRNLAAADRFEWRQQRLPCDVSLTLTFIHV